MLGAQAQVQARHVSRVLFSCVDVGWDVVPKWLWLWQVFPMHPGLRTDYLPKRS